MKGWFSILLCSVRFGNFIYGTNNICKTGWTLINGYCYLLDVNNELHKANALTECTGLGAEVLLPRSEAETNGIIGISSFGQSGVQLWINAKYETDLGKWVDNSGNDLTWTNWDQYQPEANKLCATLKKNGKWASRGCTTGNWGPKALGCVDDPCKGNPCGGFACKGGVCDYCSPNQCKTGVCLSVQNQKFPNYKYTCKCPDRYDGPNCTLIDDPCVNDPKAKCKNNGECKTKQQPGKNDWFCVCPGKPKKGQAKDCSAGKSEDTRRYEYKRKVVLAAAVGVPFGLIAVGWVVCCIFECIEVGEVPDVDTAVSDTPTTSYATETDVEMARTSGEKGEASTKKSDLKSEASTKDSVLKSEASKRTTKDAVKNGKRKVSLLKTETVRSGSTSLSSSIKSGFYSNKGEKDKVDHNDQADDPRFRRYVLLYKDLDQEKLRSMAEKDRTSHLSDSIGESEDEKIIRQSKVRYVLRHDKLMQRFINKDDENIVPEKDETGIKKYQSKK